MLVAVLRNVRFILIAPLALTEWQMRRKECKLELDRAQTVISLAHHASKITVS